MCSLGGNRLRAVAVFFCLLMVLLAGCELSADLRVSGTPTSCTSASGSSCGLGSGAQHLTLYVEPADGVTPVTDAIHNAHQSVWVEVYLLTNANVMTALEDASNQGLDVRVMLDPQPLGSSSISVQQTLDKLKAAGIKTTTGNPAFQFTHAKFMVIDNNVLFLMTANMSAAALGTTRKPTNREFLLYDTEAQDVQEAAAIFTNDWNRTTPTLSDANLIVSPVNSRAKILALINSAKETLYIENEEMQDDQVEQALADAARRGVKVQVVLPAPDSGDTDSNGDGVSFLKKANVSVRENKKLYIHAKIIIIDEQEAYVGSENFSSTSLDRNRELGMLIASASIIQGLETAFMTDYTNAA